MAQVPGTVPIQAVAVTVIGAAWLVVRAAFPDIELQVNGTNVAVCETIDIKCCPLVAADCVLSDKIFVSGFEDRP